MGWECAHPDCAAALSKLQRPCRARYGCAPHSLAPQPASPSGKGGQEPLLDLCCAGYGRKEVALQLLQAGADILAMNKAEQRPLDAAKTNQEVGSGGG